MFIFPADIFYEYQDIWSVYKLLQKCDESVLHMNVYSYIIKPLVSLVSDPQELFVPSSDYYKVVHLRSNWPAVLPCHVTNPQARVTLHREFPPAEVKVDGSEISYDVTRGFTIHRPKAHHAGLLYCVASVGNLRQSSIKYMLIHIHCECNSDTSNTSAMFLISNMST